MGRTDALRQSVYVTMKEPTDGTFFASFCIVREIVVSFVLNKIEEAHS